MCYGYYFFWFRYTYIQLFLCEIHIKTNHLKKVMKGKPTRIATKYYYNPTKKQMNKMDEMILEINAHCGLNSITEHKRLEREIYGKCLLNEIDNELH